MSGWGQWLEKGKQLAVQFEEHLNESVGVETANATETPGAEAFNDAWNEDFDDDILLEETVPPKTEIGNNEEEEEIVLENLQPEKKELFESSILEHLGNDSNVALAPIETEPSMVEEKPPVSITEDDHFAPVPKSQEDNWETDGGWDDDLHIDSHDLGETPADQVPEKEVERTKSPKAMAQPSVKKDSMDPPSPNVVDTPDAPTEEAPTSLPVQDVATPEGDIENFYPSLYDQNPQPSRQESTTKEGLPEAESVQQEMASDILAPKLSFEEPPAEPKEEQIQAQTDEQIMRLKEEHQMAMVALQSQVEDLELQLRQREDQLTSKAEQLTTMQAIFESEKDGLRQKIFDTKEEAKKRILKAKERVEAMEKRMTASSKSVDEAGAQEEIIAALREEGKKLAHKQSEMEKAVRSAKGETRELKDQLADETTAKEKGLEKIASLESELKRTKDDLASARKGESQVVKLETDLLALREECERKASANLSLEQQVKELKAENKDLRDEIEQARRGAELETQLESKKLRKEHTDLLSDLETKLRTSEREATLREDALRHEVSELRKRWQDAVRRADALSMDVQQSTAPLLRQLESLERQSRARAATWAELETKLRTDLENSVIENEHLLKERNELKSTNNRLERLMKERDEEVRISKNKIENQATKMNHLETRLAAIEAERLEMKAKHDEIEKVATEGVSKVRSDMMQTVVEGEERYRAQIEKVEKELHAQRDIRAQLERQVEQLLESTGMMQIPAEQTSLPQEKQMKLRSTQGQAEILASTLTGFDSDDDDEGGPSSKDVEDSPSRGASSSFAAMEELNQRLKGTTVELSSLRERLAESERTRESLMKELIETRQAREKLPLFEAKVKELTEHNREKELEIAGLREDILEVGHLYRTQLNELLEEKAASMLAATNGNHATPSAAKQERDQSVEER